MPLLPIATGDDASAAAATTAAAATAAAAAPRTQAEWSHIRRGKRRATAASAAAAAAAAAPTATTAAASLVDPSSPDWLYGSHRRQGWQPSSQPPSPVSMMPETLPVVNPAGIMTPASRAHLERRWEMEEVHNRLLATSHEIDRKLAAERHSAWFASCR